jgi:hypothetical protein
MVPSEIVSRLVFCESSWSIPNVKLLRETVGR